MPLELLFLSHLFLILSDCLCAFERQYGHRGMEEYGMRPKPENAFDYDRDDHEKEVPRRRGAFRARARSS